MLWQATSPRGGSVRGKTAEFIRSPIPEAAGRVQLREACAKWAELVTATPLEKRERIRRIVSKPPQPAGEEIDLIEAALSGHRSAAVLHRACLERVEWLEPGIGP